MKNKTNQSQKTCIGGSPSANHDSDGNEDMENKRCSPARAFVISEPSYTKQQREITTICVVCEPKPRRQIILISIWNST